MDTKLMRALRFSCFMGRYRQALRTDCSNGNLGTNDKTLSVEVVLANMEQTGVSR